MENFPTTMLRFVRDVYGAVALDEAWAEFHLWDEDEPGFDPDSHHLQLFMPWFFHQWAPDPFETSVADPVLHDRTPTTVLLERRGRRLEPVLRRYLEACVARPFSFHEIVRVDPGRGFRARDVMTGEELDVLERSASRTMEAGDILFGQLVPSEGVTLMEACSPHMIPAGEKLRLIDLRDRIARGAPLATDESLRDWDTELRIEYLRQIDALRNPSMPRVQNTDGEVLEFHRLSFAFPSAQEAFDALKSLALDETESELLEAAELDAEGRVRRSPSRGRRPATPFIGAGTTRSWATSRSTARGSRRASTPRVGRRGSASLSKGCVRTRGTSARRWRRSRRRWRPRDGPKTRPTSPKLHRRPPIRRCGSGSRRLWRSSTRTGLISRSRRSTVSRLWRRSSHAWAARRWKSSSPRSSVAADAWARRSTKRSFQAAELPGLHVALAVDPEESSTS